MVKLLLDVFGANAEINSAQSREGKKRRAIKCYHVNARLSEGIADIGRMRPSKILLLLCYCFQAIFYRFRFGMEDFYYVPANPGRAALYRDWMVMLLCRPFFKRLIFHWHAVGLGEWLTTTASPVERAITGWLLGRPDLSIVLAEFNREDASALKSKQIAVVPNGIPDPCPDFEASVRNQPREASQQEQDFNGGNAVSQGEKPGAKLRTFRVLYIGLCLREKGLFDAVEAIGIANEKLQKGPDRIQLSVAGTFYRAEEQEAFEKRIQEADLHREGPLIRYLGFVGGKEKDRLFRESDCICFPTYYSAESFGLVLVEAMAYGLPIVTTNWRMIPEILPPGYQGITEPRAPEQLAQGFIRAMGEEGRPLRQRFLEKYEMERFGDGVESALLSLDKQ